MRIDTGLGRYCWLLILVCVILLLQACNGSPGNLPFGIEKKVGVSFEESFKYCDSEDKRNVQEQVGPNNILAGISTKSDIVDAFGSQYDVDLDRIKHDKTNFYLEDNFVYEIIDLNIIPLEEIIRKYGCPDFLFTTKGMEDADEWAYLIFMKGGVEFRIGELKINKNSYSDGTRYIPSNDTIDDFYANNPIYKTLVLQKWNDVVIP